MRQSMRVLLMQAAPHRDVTVDLIDLPRQSLGVANQILTLHRKQHQFRRGVPLLDKTLLCRFHGHSRANPLPPAKNRTQAAIHAWQSISGQ
jgi:hypothetical protein